MPSIPHTTYQLNRHNEPSQGSFSMVPVGRIVLGPAPSHWSARGCAPMITGARVLACLHIVRQQIRSAQPTPRLRASAIGACGDHRAMVVAAAAVQSALGHRDVDVARNQGQCRALLVDHPAPAGRIHHTAHFHHARGQLNLVSIWAGPVSGTSATTTTKPACGL